VTRQAFIKVRMADALVRNDWVKARMSSPAAVHLHRRRLARPVHSGGFARRRQGSQPAADARERPVQPDGAHLLADAGGARRHLQAAAGDESSVSGRRPERWARGITWWQSDEGSAGWGRRGDGLRFERAGVIGAMRRASSQRNAVKCGAIRLAQPC